MDGNLQIMSSLVSIAVFLAAFPALWISGRIILRNDTSDNSTSKVFIWFALAGLILNPLIDFIRYLGDLLSLIIPSLRNTAPIIVFLGAGPSIFYSTLTLVFGIIVYGLGIYYMRVLVAQDQIPFLKGLQLRNWELGFVLLGIVSLINQMVRGIVIRFVSIYLPSLTAQQDFVQGVVSFWISWLLGLIILLVTVFIMNERIDRMENEQLS